MMIRFTLWMACAALLIALIHGFARGGQPAKASGFVLGLQPVSELAPSRPDPQPSVRGGVSSRRIADSLPPEPAVSAAPGSILVLASDGARFVALDPTRHTAGRPIEVTGDLRVVEQPSDLVEVDASVLRWKERTFRRASEDVERALGVEGDALWVESGLHAIWCRGTAQPAGSFLGKVRVLDASGRQGTEGAQTQSATVELDDQAHSADGVGCLPPCLLARAGPRYSPRLAVDCPGHAPALVYPGASGSASVVELEPAGRLALTIKAYRPAPPLTLELTRSSSEKPVFRSKLAEVLSETRASVRFDGLPTGEYRIRVVDGAAFAVHQSTVTVERDSLATGEVDLLASESDGDQYGHLQLTVILPLSRELLSAQLGVPLSVQIEPIDVRLAQIGAFRPSPIPLASFSPTARGANGYVHEFKDRVPFGEYRVRVLGLGVIGRVQVEQRGINQVSVQCAELLEWHLRITGPVAMELGDWMWTASVERAEGEASGSRLPARLVRSGADSFHLYAAPGRARLVGRRRGAGGTIMEAFDLRRGESSIEVELARPAGCVIRLYHDGEPVSFEIDRWPDVSTVDDGSSPRLLGIRPVDQQRAMGTANAIGLSATSAGPARLKIQTIEPDREIEVSVMFDESFPEFRVDLRQDDAPTAAPRLGAPR